MRMWSQKGLIYFADVDTTSIEIGLILSVRVNRADMVRSLLVIIFDTQCGC